MLFPINSNDSVSDTKGNLEVNSCKALKRIAIPGEIAPPKYSFLQEIKSYVIEVPASITKQFLFSYFRTAAAAKAILSTPKVVGVPYKLTKGTFVA